MPVDVSPGGQNNSDEHGDALVRFIRRWRSCLIAFSGGVDSTVVAQAARLALGDAAVAVTGVSPALADGELEAARRLAARIGIRHEVIATEEFADPGYVANSPQRCYHCKSELYRQLDGLAARFSSAVIFNGTNADDLGDYRPGLSAAAEHAVESPLAACGLGKEAVRALAARWGLPVWDKPASPCLSSRVAYGETVTPERLAMIDRAERLLRDAGLSPVRVRYHKGDLARVEVPIEALGRLCEEKFRRRLVEELTALGFKYITLDLAGHRSGSQNAVLPIEALRNYRG